MDADPGLRSGSALRRHDDERQVPTHNSSLIESALAGMCAELRPLDELAAQQIAGCAVIQFDVVEWIREDLGCPDQPGLHVLDLEQMHRPKQQPADTDR